MKLLLNKTFLYAASLWWANIFCLAQVPVSVSPTNAFPGTNSLVQTNTLSATSSAPVLTPRVDYPSFRMIAERNIFNPNRSRRRTQNYREERRSTPRTEGFSLIGTMSYEKGLFAFFEGTSSEYRKVLKTGDEIAGYKVAEIGYNRVKLASTTNELELPIGMQMRREEEGPWSVGQPTGPYSNLSSSSSGPSASTPATSGVSTTAFTERGQAVTASNGEGGQLVPGSGTTNTTPETSSGGSESEILKRLMERREETLNK